MNLTPEDAQMLAFAVYTSTAATCLWLDVIITALRDRRSSRG